MKRNIDITSEQHETLLALLAKHLPDTTVWVYGSRVQWTARPRSDLDMVVFASPSQNSQVSALREALEESNLPFRVDLFVWDEVPDQFRKHFEADHAKLVSKKESKWTGSEWSEATIDEISEKVAMGPFGSSIKVAMFVADGVPVISGQHLHGLKIDDSPGFNFISSEHARRLSNSNVKHGDVIFTHAGNIGQVAYIPSDSKFNQYVISQRQFYMRCDCSKAIPEFVTLYFKSPEGQHKLLANTAQVGVPSIAQPVSYLRTIEIPLPPITEQRAIAHILCTLDDKIELNRRMNETLEAMAQALFKSWFVDFDPVHAKATLKCHDLHHSHRQGSSTKVQANTPSHSGITPPSKSRNNDPSHSEITPLFNSQPNAPSRSGITPPLKVQANTPSHSGITPPLKVQANTPSRSGITPPSKVQANTPSRSGITPPLRGSRQDKGASPQSSRWGVINRQYSQQTLKNAKTLRQNQTNAEGLLWHYLRNKQLDGHKFRCQQPIGPYIVDFACLSRNLIIELDGGQHAKQKACDEKRDTFLKDKGYRILRFGNNEVFENCFGVLESIYNALHQHTPLEGEAKDANLSGSESPPPPQPSPDGSASATPPPGGSEWTPERARAYLDSMDDAIMTLFPDSFEDSELGKIPKGWKVMPTEDIAEVSSGKRPGAKYSETSPKAKVPLWGGNGPMAFVPEPLIEYPILLTGRVGTLGSVFRITSPCWPSDNTLIFKIKDKRVFEILFFQLKRIDFASLNRGSTQPLVTQTNLKEQIVLLPSAKILEQFHTLTKALFARLDDSEIESRTLSALRDTLLPKLVSGETRVYEIEKLKEVTI